MEHPTDLGFAYRVHKTGEVTITRDGRVGDGAARRRCARFRCTGRGVAARAAPDGMARITGRYKRGQRAARRAPSAQSMKTRRPELPHASQCLCRDAVREFAVRIRRAHVNVTERIQSGARVVPMKKVALYSSSNRSRKARRRRRLRPRRRPAEAARACARRVRGEALLSPLRAADPRRRRARCSPWRSSLTYAKTRPVPHELTQKDIDQAVLHTLENTNLPSMATKAAAAIAPSVVRVMGYGLDKGDDEEKEKERARGTTSPRTPPRTRTRTRRRTRRSRPPRTRTRPPAKDKLARNDGGVHKAPEPKAKERRQGQGAFQGRRQGQGPGKISRAQRRRLPRLSQHGRRHRRGHRRQGHHPDQPARGRRRRADQGRPSSTASSPRPTVIGVQPENDLAVLQAQDAARRPRRRRRCARPPTSRPATRWSRSAFRSASARRCRPASSPA